MAIKIPSEYNDTFDFGFTAVESEESIVEKQVVNTAPMIDGLSAVEDKVSIILNKIDYLEEIIKRVLVLIIILILLLINN